MTGVRSRRARSWCVLLRLRTGDSYDDPEFRTRFHSPAHWVSLIVHGQTRQSFDVDVLLGAFHATLWELGVEGWGIGSLVMLVGI